MSLASVVLGLAGTAQPQLTSASPLAAAAAAKAASPPLPDDAPTPTTPIQCYYWLRLHFVNTNAHKEEKGTD
jgi:hypothetical protein